ncbi:MAG: hypothetical protein IPH89_16065 [Bacteroidetes bacterium]|nr:hypothetical protein [Bacteroidota bacterium]
MFKEIIKQLFDIGCLFDAIDDVDLFRKSYNETVKAEIIYRPERNIKSKEEVLKDTIETALIIARREKQLGQESKQQFTDLSKGLSSFNHLFISEISESNMQWWQAQRLLIFLLLC